MSGMYLTDALMALPRSSLPFEPHACSSPSAAVSELPPVSLLAQDGGGASPSTGAPPSGHRGHYNYIFNG